MPASINCDEEIKKVSIELSLNHIWGVKLYLKMLKTLKRNIDAQVVYYHLIFIFLHNIVKTTLINLEKGNYIIHNISQITTLFIIHVRRKF